MNEFVSPKIGSNLGMTLKPPLPMNQITSNRKNPSVSVPMSPAARALKEIHTGLV